MGRWAEDIFRAAAPCFAQARRPIRHHPRPDEGGGAHNPSPLELRRLRLVARHYHAREVVLFQ